MSERSWKLISLALLIWSVGITSLYLSHALSTHESGFVTVNVAINYGDGRVEWHNGTLIPKGSTLLEVTQEVAEVNFTVHTGMGAFVNSINGVENEDPFYWMWWCWSPSSGWTLGPVAADKYVVSDGEILMWYYENASRYPPPKP